MTMQKAKTAGNKNKKNKRLFRVLMSLDFALRILPPYKNNRRQEFEESFLIPAVFKRVLLLYGFDRLRSQLYKPLRINLSRCHLMENRAKGINAKAVGHFVLLPGVNLALI